jgi:beta-lactamase class D
MSALACGLLRETHAAPTTRERADWTRFFTEAEATGCLVVLDARNGAEALHVANRKRAEQRYTPASTFKVPHSLFALDAGLLRDEFQVIKWDGVKRSRPAWNADQDLRSAMRNSALWVYERFARELGEKRETDYLRKTGYGNALATGKAPFWVDGGLAISAFEQVAFLQRLYRNQLPFDVAHQRLVKDVMVNEAGADWILRAKTGWSGSLGWWVGWVERPSGAVFFAINIDTPNRDADLPKRQSIVRAALREMKVLEPTG